MTSDGYRRVRLCIAIWFTLAMGPQALAAPPVVVGPPVFGPVEQPARPLVLLFRAHYVDPKNPFDKGLVGIWLANNTEKRFHSAAEHVDQTIRTAVPGLDVGSEIRAAFRCGEANSLCTEMVVPDERDPEYASEAALSSLFRSHGWSDVRVLSIWWEQDDRHIASHAALHEVQAIGDKLAWRGVPVLASYWITAPRTGEKKTDGPVVHSEEWEPGAPLPREAALRMAATRLEPLLRMGLSWGVNNDPISKQRTEGKPAFRRLRNEGIECNGLTQCIQGFDSVVDDRAWIWHYLAPAPGIKSSIVELESRSRIDP